MKIKIFTFIAACLLSVVAYSQTGLQNIRFTGKPNATNGLDIYAKNISGTDISGTLGATSLTLCVLVPSSISPKPTVTVSSPILGQTFFPQVYTATGITISGITYDIYSYNGNGVTSSIDFAPGVPVLIATYSFANSPVVASDLALGFLVAAGPSGFDNYYIAPNGFDETDYSNPFYSDISSDPGLHNSNGLNDPSLNSLSYLVVTNVILPIKFTGFSATKKDDNALLSWSVTNESINTSSYEIERSFNGVDFSPVASVPVKVSASFTSNTYTYTDEGLSALNSSGVIYYRIMQVDKNGNTSYTEIKTVQLKTSALAISAYPNPAKDVLSLTFSLVEEGNVAVHISDASGRLVQQLQLHGVKGINVNRINMASFAPGSYLLKVNTGTENTTLPIVKE